MPVILHERPSQPGIDFEVVTKALGQVLDPFGMRSAAGVRRSAGERAPASHRHRDGFPAAFVVMVGDRAACQVRGFYYRTQPVGKGVTRPTGRVCGRHK